MGSAWQRWWVVERSGRRLMRWRGRAAFKKSLGLPIDHPIVIAKDDPTGLPLKIRGVAQRCGLRWVVWWVVLCG